MRCPERSYILPLLENNLDMGAHMLLEYSQTILVDITNVHEGVGKLKRVD